jgi:alpha-beta hydrolase superfamily lysophospholipase
MIRWLLYAIGLCAVVLATIVLVFAIQARLLLPELRAWHRVALEEEFRATGAGASASFDDYCRLEGRLFSELRRRLLENPAAADTQLLGRFNPRSVPAHLALDTTYNRSFELVPREARGAVLLVHGLSDSPYSMRGLADTFFAQGYYVLVLRLPGHGTAPSSLLETTWEDWYAAVVLAAKHVAARAGPGRPFLAGGHSTGAALLTLYSLRALDDPALPRPERLVLVSPAIGISRLAVLTNVIAGLSFIPWFEKSKWLDVQPEYDPYKYNSFPVNAANQIYSLTRALRRTILSAAQAGRLGGMPRVLVFQSIVDSTVTAAEVVRGLLAHLPPRGHELVVFDVNRREILEGLLAPGPLEDLERLRTASELPFRLTVVGNRPGGTGAIAAFTREAGSREFVEEDLPLEWPRGVFSLGHVALPFPPDDPVYGLAGTPGNRPEFNLGAVSARGETGALLVPLGTFARLRSNPFFDVIRARIVQTLATDVKVGP